jgi:hypothetical protein
MTDRKVKSWELEGGLRFGSRNYTTLCFWGAGLLTVIFALTVFTEGKYDIRIVIGIIGFLLFGIDSVRSKKCTSRKGIAGSNADETAEGAKKGDIHEWH